MCSAVFMSILLAAENVSAACVGWGKYAQIRERDPDRFSATLKAHLGLYNLCVKLQFCNKASFPLLLILLLLRQE